MALHYESSEGVTNLLSHLGGNTAPHSRSTYFTTNTNVVKVPANVNCKCSCIQSKIDVGD